MKIKQSLKSYSKPMFTTNGAASYQYEDDEQACLVFEVWNLTGWDMVGFDQWLGTPAAWKNHPQKLAYLTELRSRLTHAYRQRGNDNELLTVYANWLLAESHRTAGVIRGAPLEVKQQQQSKKQALRRVGSSILKPHDRRNIRRQWKNAFSTYGMIKQLARDFEVSTATISRIVHSCNDSITSKPGY